MEFSMTYLVIGGIIAVVLVGMMMIASWFRKAGPNEALIVYSVEVYANEFAELKGVTQSPSGVMVTDPFPVLPTLFA